MVSEEITPDPKSRPAVHTIQHEPEKKAVVTDCGCVLLADHAEGERAMTCSHGYKHAVKACYPVVVYKTRRLSDT
jgi:hypothetical protein